MQLILQKDSFPAMEARMTTAESLVEELQRENNGKRYTQQ